MSIKNRSVNFHNAVFETSFVSFIHCNLLIFQLKLGHKPSEVEGRKSREIHIEKTEKRMLKLITIIQLWLISVPLVFQVWNVGFEEIKHISALLQLFHAISITKKVTKNWHFLSLPPSTLSYPKDWSFIWLLLQEI